MTSLILRMPTKFRHVLPNFIEVVKDANSMATVSRLARLEYPELFFAFFIGILRDGLLQASDLECLELRIELKPAC